MTKRIATNVAASVRQRLYNLAKEKQEDFNFVLGRFVAERLLFRMSVSEHGSDFVLKGALLFLLWSDHLYQSDSGCGFAWLSRECPSNHAPLCRASQQVSVGYVVSREMLLQPVGIE